MKTVWSGLLSGTTDDYVVKSQEENKVCMRLKRECSSQAKTGGGGGMEGKGRLNCHPKSDLAYFDQHLGANKRWSKYCIRTPHVRKICLTFFTRLAGRIHGVGCTKNCYPVSDAVGFTNNTSQDRSSSSYAEGHCNGVG